MSGWVGSGGGRWECSAAIGRGGKIDRALLFFMDTIYTLPGLLLSVTLAFVVGRGVLNAAIALSIAYVPQYYRSRSQSHRER